MTSVSYPGFGNATGLDLVGDTAVTTTSDGSVLRIVPSLGDQAGAAYSTSAVALGSRNTFNTTFKFRFTDPNGVDPADGITFVLAQSPTGLGGSGYAMGYEGVFNSLAIEFDTYNNGNSDSLGYFPAEPDSSNHVAIDLNGTLTNTDATNVYGIASAGFPDGEPEQNNYDVPGAMSNGDLWTVNISYNGSLLNVTLFDPAENTSFSAISNYAINIGSIVGGNTAYVGFTGSTGAGEENEDIVSWSFSSAATRPAEDFNGDGKSDLLLQNSNGAIVIETQANLGITGGYNVGNPGPAWHVVGSGDFDGDGQADLLLQNDSGALVSYEMNGTSIRAGTSFGNPGSAWHVRGIGDFNADGDADIVLQNDGGSIVIYNTNGISATNTAFVANPGAGWTVEGVADFDGDGTPDILLQNTNGDLVVYRMSGDTVVSGADLGNPGVGWAVAGTGDYNGDGKADIVLHNDNGADVIWDTNGASVIGAVAVGNPGASYTGLVTGVDLDGDGSADLVLENRGGSLVGFTLGSAGQITAGASLGTPGAGWTAIGNNPIQFIAGSLSANGGTQAATPGADQFNFTNFQAGLHMISGFDAAQDMVALSASTFGSYAAVQANEVAYNGGTFIALTPGSTGAALVIQGITPGQLSASNFVLR